MRFVACWTFLMLALCVTSVAQEDIWLDVDPSIGFGEVDDGLFMIQAFHSPEVKVRGVSVVFGNTSLRYGMNAGYNVMHAFGPGDIEVHAGAENAAAFGQESPAVTAMAEALRREPMTVLAVGPVTNVGTLVKLHPELVPRIKAIVVVAGRRPGQKFITTEMSKRTFPPDFNFESDVPAMQAILDTPIPVVLAPWEVSSKVWVTANDMAVLRESSRSGYYLWANSLHWLASWKTRRGVEAFNPYDCLALGWVTHPQLIEGMDVAVAIETGPDDRATAEEQAAGKTKSYLHVRPLDAAAAADAGSRRAIYLHTPDPAFKAMLLDRLAATPAKSAVDHRLWDRLLKRYDSDLGRVNYAAIKADSADLDAYLASLATVDIASLEPADRLALLINAYNACTVRLICDYYPITSIKDIPEDKRWKDQRWLIGGNRWSLDQIEHEQIRVNFHEPRIHFALVCAAVDCPPLRQEAYSGARLEGQLADQSQRLHGADRWFSWQPATKTLELTSLYKWYGKDFLVAAPSLVDYLALARPDLATALRDPALNLVYKPYDWSLNVDAQPAAK